MNTLVLPVLVALLMTGCADMLPYIEGKKMTICIGGVDENVTCPDAFTEFDGTVVPRVGEYVSPIAENVLTCVDYSDKNVSCPAGTKQITIDLIK